MGKQICEEVLPHSCEKSQGGRALPPTSACAPQFGLLKILFLKHHVTARQQAMMEKK